MDWNGTGMSVMELSHRGKSFVSIAEKAEADLRALLDIPANFKVYFCGGGACLQFTAIPFNLCAAEDSANYVTSGTWSEGALGEGKKYVKAHEVANNKGNKYATIQDPAEWNIDQNAKYFHYCSNETI
jgi:phosphoserine aminotransferase